MCDKMAISAHIMIVKIYSKRTHFKASNERKGNV